MSFIKQLLSDGWFSRFMLMAMYWYSWELMTWSQAFASTALATGKDLLGASAVIASTAAAPLGLLTLALNKYMDMKAAQPKILPDRRSSLLNKGGKSGQE